MHWKKLYKRVRKHERVQCNHECTCTYITRRGRCITYTNEYENMSVSDKSILHTIVGTQLWAIMWRSHTITALKLVGDDVAIADDFGVRQRWTPSSHTHASTLFQKSYAKGVKTVCIAVFGTSETMWYFGTIHITLRMTIMLSMLVLWRRRWRLSNRGFWRQSWIPMVGSKD